MIITSLLRPCHIFLASQQFKEDVVKVGLEFQINKSACFIDEYNLMKNGMNSEIVFQMEALPLTMLLYILVSIPTTSPSD